MRVALLLASLGLTGCSPYGGGAFTCTSDSDCVSGGRTGMCQGNGFCSFPDSACPSGERYGGLSGDVSNLCVGEQAQGDDGGLVQEPDASMIDAAATSKCYGSFVRECFASA